MQIQCIVLQLDQCEAPHCMQALMRYILCKCAMQAINSLRQKELFSSLQVAHKQVQMSRAINKAGFVE